MPNLPSIYYACSLPVRAGGELVNFQHVASLRKQGLRAFVLLNPASHVGVPSQPYSVPMVHWGEQLTFSTDDWLVVPEVMPPESFNHLAQLPCRIVIHNQNPFYTLRGFVDMATMSDYSLAGGLCCSRFTRDTPKRWGSTSDWQVVRPMPPLPALIAVWCHELQPVFVDVGANTGFYSLLALAAGAVHTHGFEPVEEIAAVFMSNAAVSEVGSRLTLHPTALGREEGEATLYFPRADHGLVETSASLNAEFRQEHAGQCQVRVATLDSVMPEYLSGQVPLLIKIDVESHEPEVLRGATSIMKNARPALVCELLPGYNEGSFTTLCREYGYTYFSLESGMPVEAALNAVSETGRDHLFLPDERKIFWLAPLAQEMVDEGYAGA